MSVKKEFWSTLPGILTGSAAILGAVASLLGILYQLHVIGPRPQLPIASFPRSEVSKPSLPSGTFRIVEMTLRSDPFDYSGPCPVEITFRGRISVAGGGGTVSYKFLRSDGGSAPLQTLVFAGPGSKDVTHTWNWSEPGSFSGWEAVKTFDPEERESVKADFRITCR